MFFRFASALRFLSTLMLLWCAISYANAAPPLLINMETMNWTVHLPAAGKDIEPNITALSSPGLVPGWQPHAVPALVTDTAYWAMDGRLWYRLQFDAHDVAQQPALGLMLGRVLEANRVWLNTTLLGANGITNSHGSRFVSDVHSVRYYTIPSGLLRPKDNILLVEIQSMSTALGIVSGPIGIAHSGPAWRYKASAERPVLFAQSGLLALMLISLLVGVLTILALQRFDAEHIAFISLFLFALTTFGIDSLLFYQSGLKTEALQRMGYAVGLAIAIPLIIYTRALISLRPSTFSRLLIGLISTACIGLYFVNAIWLYWLVLSSLLVLILIGIVHVFVIGLPAIRNGNLAVASVLVGIGGLGGTTALYAMTDPVGPWLRSDELGMGLLMLSLLAGYVLRLMDIQNELRKMSLKLVNTAESERKHLARELHDGISQRLATTRLRLQMQEVHTNNAQIEPLSGELLIAMEEMDRLVQGLQPFNLDRHSLAQAIHIEARGLNTVKGLNIEVVAEDFELHNMLAQHLYRIFQESVQNAIKHAETDFIWVELYRKRNRLTLSIRDEGNGFDKVKPQTNRTGIGMISLSERVALIGGTLHIDSAIGAGTHIFVQVDIE